jgi:hypothetical protein
MPGSGLNPGGLEDGVRTRGYHDWSDGLVRLRMIGARL